MSRLGDYTPDRPTVPPAPFDLDTSHRDETAPRSPLIRAEAPAPRQMRDPVFIRELRRAFKEARGLE